MLIILSLINFLLIKITTANEGEKVIFVDETSSITSIYNDCVLINNLNMKLNLPQLLYKDFKIKCQAEIYNIKTVPIATNRSSSVKLMKWDSIYFSNGKEACARYDKILCKNNKIITDYHGVIYFTSKIAYKIKRFDSFFESEIEYTPFSNDIVDIDVIESKTDAEFIILNYNVLNGFNFSLNLWKDSQFYEVYGDLLFDIYEYDFIYYKEVNQHFLFNIDYNSQKSSIFVSKKNNIIQLFKINKILNIDILLDSNTDYNLELNCEEVSKFHIDDTECVLTSNECNNMQISADKYSINVEILRNLNKDFKFVCTFEDNYIVNFSTKTIDLSLLLENGTKYEIEKYYRSYPNDLAHLFLEYNNEKIACMYESVGKTCNIISIHGSKLDLKVNGIYSICYSSYFYDLSSKITVDSNDPYQCTTSIIDRIKVCDGINDCDSDESNCANYFEIFPVGVNQYEIAFLTGSTLQLVISNTPELVNLPNTLNNGAKYIVVNGRLKITVVDKTKIVPHIITTNGIRKIYLLKTDIIVSEFNIVFTTYFVFTCDRFYLNGDLCSTSSNCYYGDMIQIDSKKYYLYALKDNDKNFNVRCFVNSDIYMYFIKKDNKKNEISHIFNYNDIKCVDANTKVMSSFSNEIFMVDQSGFNSKYFHKKANNFIFHLSGTYEIECKTTSPARLTYLKQLRVECENELCLVYKHRLDSQSVISLNCPTYDSPTITVIEIENGKNVHKKLVDNQNLFNINYNGLQIVKRNNHVSVRLVSLKIDKISIICGGNYDILNVILINNGPAIIIDHDILNNKDKDMIVIGTNNSFEITETYSTGNFTTVIIIVVLLASVCIFGGLFYYLRIYRKRR